ncbi:hypothetical protein Tco_0065948 [Tanacetum coccineum]
MCTYLKNMEGYKMKDFKGINFVEITLAQALAELKSAKLKDDKVDDDKETAELKQLMKIIQNDEDVAIDAISLAVKSPKIIDWKIYKEGRRSYYQIIRANGKSQMYRIFSQMLKSFDREDLEDLYKLGDLKIMFEPHVEEEIWKLQQRYKVLSWKLFDSCGVHCLTLQSRKIYMLVEKRYPLTPPTITNMLNKKLQVDYFNEMAYQLLKLLKKQLKK